MVEGNVQLKLFRNISVLLAGTILMLHTFLPHQHHAELNEQQHLAEHQAAKSLFDCLKLAFHADLGEDHLETYQTADSSPSFFQLDFKAKALPDFAPKLLEETFSFPQPFPISPYTRLIIPQLRFRGPPLQA